MKLEFKDIINKHKNRSALVVAHGSSLNNYLDKLDKLKKKGFILLDCNEWYCFHKNIPDYWVTANNEINMKNSCNRINKYNITIFYADSVDLTDRQWADEKIKCNYLPYDQRHFSGKQCIPTSDCCKHIIPDRLTIQEELMKYTSYLKKYSTGHLVSVHMLSFAILMGCNPIYFIGMDLNYGKGYAKHFQHVREVPAAEFSSYVDYTIEDLEIVRDSAKNIKVDIINLNKDSEFDIFKKGSL